jgi:hypothetical protein
MDEHNVKADAEYSNSSNTSSTSEAISRNVKNVVDPFSLVEVKCEFEVSTVIKFLISVHFNKRRFLVFRHSMSYKALWFRNSVYRHYVVLFNLLFICSHVQVS